MKWHQDGTLSAISQSLRQWQSMLTVACTVISTQELKRSEVSERNCEEMPGKQHGIVILCSISHRAKQPGRDFGLGPNSWSERLQALLRNLQFQLHIGR